MQTTSNLESPWARFRALVYLHVARIVATTGGRRYVSAPGEEMGL